VHRCTRAFDLISETALDPAESPARIDAELAAG
jgi:hypothetical protein